MARTSRARRSLLVAAVAALLLPVGCGWTGPTVEPAPLELVGSDPPDGATLLTLPQAVTLTFTEVNGTVSIITVHDPIGRPVSIDTPELAGADSLRVPLAVLTDPGRYETRYMVTAADGHQVDGVLTFTLAARADPTVPEPPATDALDR